MFQFFTADGGAAVLTGHNYLQVINRLHSAIRFCRVYTGSIRYFAGNYASAIDLKFSGKQRNKPWPAEGNL